MHRGMLRAAIEGAIRDATRVVAPAGIGAHPDHVAVRDVALELAREQQRDVILYADLPYAIRFGWPAWVTGNSPQPFLVPDAPWQAELPADVALRPYPIALDPAEREQKIRALECYATQFAALNAGPLDRLRHPEIIGYEARFAVTFP
jgi:LmbE family N-acetylglucosaminyl deacetylase